jgi:hypothetical protein
LGVAVSGQAVVDSPTSRRLGVEAFTEGTTTHFSARQPRVEVAAHEAAHQLQNLGRTRDANLGPEGHAEAVAHSVARGQSAKHLVGSGATNAAAARAYTEIPVPAQTGSNWVTPSKLPVRVSDDGKMAATQDGAYGTHELWANPALVSASNSILNAQKSVIRLHTTSGKLGGPVPSGGTSSSLTRVEPESVATATAGDTMSIWADCGRAARDVMGTGGTGRVAAVYTRSGAEVRTSADRPDDMKNEIIRHELGGGTSVTMGWAKYNTLSPPDRDAFDKKSGINRYAAPRVGEGFTISTGGAAFPGKSTWNFHWAGVVLRSGGDVATLENYAVSDVTVKNTDWNFQMYGAPARPGQTFHEQHLASQQHGMKPTTMRVSPL